MEAPAPISAPDRDPFLRRATPGANRDVRDLWDDLVSGRVTIRADEHVGGRWLTVLSASAGNGLASRDRIIVNRITRGEPPKSIAVDLNVSLSTLSYRTDAALRSLNVSHRLAAIRLATALSCGHARRVPIPLTPGDVVSDDIVVETRANARTLSLLTASERRIVDLVLDGTGNVAIAAECRISTRTVANHLASIYRKLKTSGRAALARYLFQSSTPLIALSRS